VAGKKTGRRRGRPRLANAKRRQRTRIGRRTGHDSVDEGSLRLRQRKRRLTGREDVEMTPAGVLYGHELLDRAQYNALGFVTELLRRIARGFGGGASPAALWAALAAAASRPTPGMPAIFGDSGARRALSQICKRLDGSKNLLLALAAENIFPPICV
jgi:hypothetical protein